MQKISLKEKYPVYLLKISKDETTFQDADAIVEYLYNKVESHPFAVNIAIFDHYAHTQSIDDHVLDENIKAAKDLIFCFGKQLPIATMLAVRPRSVGVAEFEDSFEINFLEVPNEQLQTVLEDWVKSVKNK